MSSHRSFHGCSLRRDAEAGHRASHNDADLVRATITAVGIWWLRTVP
jgi:hypothetical protein